MTRLLCLLADALDHIGTWGQRMAARLDVRIQARFAREYKARRW